MGDANLARVSRLVTRESSKPRTLDSDEGLVALGARLLDESQRPLERGPGACRFRDPCGGEQNVLPCSLRGDLEGEAAGFGHSGSSRDRRLK